VSNADRMALLLLGAIWGASFLFMRVAVPEFGPVALIGLRVTIGLLVLIALLAARGDLQKLRGHGWRWLVLGAVNTAIPFTLFAFATKSLGAGLPAVLNSTVPLFGALIGGLLLSERLSSQRVLGLLLGFAGVVVLVYNKISFSGDPEQTQSVAAGLAAALLYACAAHYTKRHFTGVAPLVVATGNMLGATLLMLPLLPFVWPERMPSLPAYGAALTLGVVCTALAYVLYFRLIPRIGTTRAISVTYLVPVFGLLWGWFFLDEPLGLRTLIGSAIVLAGTALVLRAPAAQPTLAAPKDALSCPNSPTRTAP
jgi:drug/metabolite transporter (DMT)-like permease